ncbi:uncharacterized protein LOC126844638 [Adelges cooleyi]|uniref:uncharacterized protein LOC126844638 n=1 Tax=Adelges cooleyi TaxID=133065 RepID=UPI00217F2851|nr:uncharacterized protein LOC126844638 [Adelges cooleyi]
MDDVINHLEHVVSNMEKRIDTLSWKIKKFESVCFAEAESSHTCRIMTLMSKVLQTCHKYDEILLLLEEHRNDQNIFTDTLQMQVNFVKSRVETLIALVTKGKTTEI